jgi:hypothetical protein
MASSKLKPQEEDTCHYCLYLESPPGIATAAIALCTKAGLKALVAQPVAI